MGYGDALMATAAARGLRAGGEVKKVAFGDGNRVKWGQPEHEIFQNNPNVADQAYADTHSVLWSANYSGHRPYVDRLAMEQAFRQRYPSEKFTMKAREAALPWCFTDWSVRSVGPGEFYFSDAEGQRGRDAAPSQKFIVIEPHSKTGASPNKQWPWVNYCDVALRLGISFVQFNANVPLPGAISLRTNSFRDAAAIMSRAEMYFGSEGGLHHAAAALNIPAVVYYGGYISPMTTGYETTRALYRNDGSPCGQRVVCGHCHNIAEDITPDEALDQINEVLNARSSERQVG